MPPRPRAFGGKLRFPLLAWKIRRFLSQGLARVPGGGLAAGGGDVPVPGSIAQAPGPGLASRVLARGGVWLRRGPGAPGVALAGEPGWWCWAPPAAPGCVGGVFHRLRRGGSAGTPPALPRGGGGTRGHPGGAGLTGGAGAGASPWVVSSQTLPHQPTPLANTLLPPLPPAKPSPRPNRASVLETNFKKIYIFFFFFLSWKFKCFGFVPFPPSPSSSRLTRLRTG